MGVGGLLTGDGISYFGSRTGWSASSVVSIRVILADGFLLEANKDENRDLWWAPKGG